MSFLCEAVRVIFQLRLKLITYAVVFLQVKSSLKLPPICVTVISAEGGESLQSLAVQWLNL